MRKVIYSIWLVSMLGLYMFIPNVGEDALTFYGLKAYGLIILGLIPLIALIISLINLLEKKSHEAELRNSYSVEYEDMDLNKEEQPFIMDTKAMIGCALIGALVLFLGIFSISKYYKDNGTEPSRIMLKGCTVYSKRSGGRHKTTNYELQGIYNSKVLAFSIKGMPASEREKLARNTGNVEVAYYPNTKVLIELSYQVDPDKKLEYKKADINAYAQENAKKMVENMKTGNPGFVDAVVSGNSLSDYGGYDTALEQLLAESYLPFELLSKASPPSDYSNTNRLCAETEDGYAKAFCSHYPADSDEFVITKISITGGDYNVYGYKVGDRFDNEYSKNLMDKHFWLEFLSKERNYDPIIPGCNEYIMFLDNVKIFTYWDQDRIIREIRVIICDHGVFNLDYE